MLIEFSNGTATLLKAQLGYIEQLSWSDENENKLDLASIKQIKGCRTKLVQDCLKFIQKLDELVERNFFNNNNKEKNYVDETIKSLIEHLKKYTASCERYPRIKDFLNIIPDNTSSMLGFILLISALMATASPVLAVIPLVIFAWVLMDLFFNNRKAAKKLTEILFTVQAELRTIEEADTIFKSKVHPFQSATQTQVSSMPSIPGTSRTVYSANFYCPAGNQNDTNSINSTSSFTATK
ncbi:MAG: hypothetical protein WBV88_05550 [Candidatus Rickettsiella isopodorum]|jgi:hypothetical protein|nr:hypothetical protein [Gammaproteobacteria bacterium]MCH9755473.1 hypothetical protein [Gammaproteobacteria bacterium]MDD4892520.1 hypothetical protein [Candidatus Rickettsiella isopodorum]MDD5161941.1 hypothetical protein [Candidatus Rickettsiella isopodorum]MDQ5900388.1 hypothetical protein [Pseudomonadota bacterium]